MAADAICQSSALPILPVCANIGPNKLVIWRMSVYVPGAGWLDFDPTNNQVPDLQHITIGWGRDYADVTPLKGVILSSGPHKLDVIVDVKRVNN